MSAFVDTSGFIAALVANDENHQAVKRVLSDLIRRQEKLVTSDYVLLEAITLLQSQVDLGAVASLNQLVHPHIQVAWVDERVHGRAMQKLLANLAPTTTLTDAVSFVIMEENGIGDVITCDPLFTEIGFRSLLDERPFPQGKNDKLKNGRAASPVNPANVS